MVERVAIDANVIVSFLTNRDAGQQARSATLFAAARDGEIEVVVPQNAVSEGAFVLQGMYSQSASEVQISLVELFELPGVAATHGLDWSLALELWPQTLRDFGDALLVAACHAAGARRVATFDRGLARRLKSLELAPHW